MEDQESVGLGGGPVAPPEHIGPDGALQGDDLTDPFGGQSAEAPDARAADAEVTLDEGEELEEADAIDLLLIQERPRFAFRADLRAALGQYLELFPLGRSSSPGAEGVSFQALTLLFLVATPAFLLLGTLAAGFAAGLGNFVGDPIRMSTSSSVLALLIDASTCGLIAIGSSVAATWAARITRCWNGILVAACASVGSILLGAATFLPLVSDMPFAPTSGQIGPFAIKWWVMAMALLIGPSVAALVASATVNASRICPDTGRLLTSTVRVRFGLPEGLAAVQAIEEESFDDLAALDGLPETTENFTELTLYMGSGANLAVLELEARFWAEEGPIDGITEASANFRQARRWLVVSTPIEAAVAQKMMGLTWQSLTHLDV